MTPAQFQKLFEARMRDIQQYARKDLPRIIGKMAVDHFHENFMRGGFVDEQLEPWKPSKRIGTESGASGSYGTLLSARKELYNSIRFQAVDYRTKVISSLRYSKIHNEGGQITQRITPQMRKFAWAKHYEAAAKGREDVAGNWKGMALQKNETRTITIPKRQYMGRSVVLKAAILDKVKRDVKRILINK